MGIYIDTFTENDVKIIEPCLRLVDKNCRIYLERATPCHHKFETPPGKNQKKYHFEQHRESLFTYDCNCENVCFYTNLG